IPDGVFPEASVDNVVFIFERSANESTRGHSEIQHAIVPANVPFEKATWHSMLQRAIKRSGECLIVLRQSEIIEPRSETVPLSELATVNFGMQLRDRSKFPQDVVETTDPTKLSRFHQPCWSGGSLGRYQLEFENLYA